ncbi:unnamed protein product [Rhizophagus irregularis]|nr:unnamed protein product [Rhizophagus irregularis]
MLMWEVSSGQPPFNNYEYDYDLAMNIVNGIRPKIVPGTPLEYKNLIKQCWDADPSKRPDRLPEPKNATEEEQEAFHSKSYKFYIPDNVNDFNNQKNNASKILSINDNDEDEIYDNPNFHSEEQDEFELPDNI